jgi:hypothetical protein
MMPSREYISGELHVIDRTGEAVRRSLDAPPDTTDGRPAARNIGWGLADNHPGSLVIIALRRIADDSNDDVWIWLSTHPDTAMEATGSDATIKAVIEHAAALVEDTGDVGMSIDLLRAAIPDPGVTFEAVTRPGAASR